MIFHQNLSTEMSTKHPMKNEETVTEGDNEEAKLLQEDEEGFEGNGERMIMMRMSKMTTRMRKTNKWI